MSIRCPNRPPEPYTPAPYAGGLAVLVDAIRKRVDAIAKRLAGTVRTVNHVGPDENGNVNVQGGGSAEGCVRYDEAQSLTDLQKAQARANIGASSGGGSADGCVRYDAAQSLWPSEAATARGNIKAAAQPSYGQQMNRIDFFHPAGSVEAALIDRPPTRNDMWHICFSSSERVRRLPVMETPYTLEKLTQYMQVNGLRLVRDEYGEIIDVVWASGIPWRTSTIRELLDALGVPDDVKTLNELIEYIKGGEEKEA